ncbi:nucleotidyltransferase family protein [Caulobacter hibisci]|uniref:Nucleotidyltransferase family protein n=1 Tax=Caulobacter hibisci TaxID=2035993 RepID=A0ABS0SZ17_9CAUL|nr:nucleotidyltransferase family protein [Caulobacter hibisci]MBI1684844.1 nucleotidyltransferase family protein [Caulobacter hibisci]
MRLEAIVLAAGAARRFGGGKLAADYRGRPLLDHALDAALDAPARTVTVALRPGDAASLALVEARPDARLRPLAAPDADEGLGASLRTAILALPADADGAFVFLGDMPLIPRGLAARLAQALDAGAGIVAPVQAGRRGHPVLFARRWFDDLAALSGDRGAQGVLAKAGDDLVLVETDDPGVLFDVDLREDLVREPGAVA